MVRRTLLRFSPTSTTPALVRLCVLAGLCLGVGSALPAVASAANYVPVAEYSFDEGTGSNVEDSSGNGNDGTVEGPTWVHGRYGSGLEFKGRKGECVTVPDAGSLQFSEEFTIEAWVRPGASTHGPIVFKEDEGEFA
jgi:hypothetical protein